MASDEPVTLLRLVRAFISLCEMYGRASREVRAEEGAKAADAPPPEPLRSRKLSEPIVPPVVDITILPTDIVWDDETCPDCGTRWRVSSGNVAVRGYWSEHWRRGFAHWTVAIGCCPTCGHGPILTVYRFRDLKGIAGKRGWMVDRLTGRVVRDGKDGWEERR